jgi:HEAT repeat protein
MTALQQFVADLATVGVVVEDPWDLVNTERSYPQAIPVLLDWLDRLEREVPEDERDKFREALLRALTVKEAPGFAAPALIREFRRARPGVTRWTVGNGLEVVADDRVFNDLVEIARDRGFGRDRQMVVLALARTSDPRATGVLAALLDDDDVAGQAVMALGRLRATEMRPAIERLLASPKPWVRSEAKKALALIDR